MNDPLLAQFVLESRECVADADKSLLALERDAHNAALLDALFRALHTIKGGAGLFDFAPITKLTHAAESALSQVRQQATELSPDLIALLFDTLDSLHPWLDAIEAGQGLEQAATEIAATLIDRYLPFLPESNHDQARTAPALSADIAWVSHLPSAAWLKPTATLSQARVAVMYTPDAACFFSGDDPLKLMRGLPGLLALDMALQTPLPDLDGLDTYQCYLRFRALSDAPQAELESYCRHLAEQILVVPLATIAPSVSGLQSVVFKQIIAAQLRILDLPPTKARTQGVVQVVKNALSATHHAEAMAGLDGVLALAGTAADHASLRSFLQALLDDATYVQTAIEPQALVASAASEAEPPLDETLPSAAKVAQSKWIKVEQAKIDQLLELLAELSVAHNGLLHKLDAEHAATLLAQVRERHGRMQRTLHDLQDLGLSIRMLPLSQVLQRLPRLTRDLAQRMDKKVRLAIEGEDTEADKKVVENLAEPLLHIVRNSIDHGIESVPERLAAGKQAEGLISVRAFHRGEQAVIEIQDDGRGIDAQVVKKKAIANKLLKKSAAEKLSPEALLQLVFLPGFSTAAQVSEVSGRGVGMDVVKSVVESVGGQVSIASQIGRSTTVTLNLPVDIALSKIMTVGVAGQPFGLPMAQVRHTLRSPLAAVRSLKKNQAFAFRDQILPLLYLRELLGLPQVATPTAEIAIVVVQTTQGLIGLAVDSFAEPNDLVVKPMAGILRGLTHYAGNALLPDGSILLILDMREVLSGAH